MGSRTARPIPAAGAVPTTASLNGQTQSPATGGVHPTQKPVELCEYFIKTYTDEGAVVADICAGSGTTAVAAMNTHRRFICFENAPSIYTIAAQRIEQARLAVAGGEKGT